VPAAQIGKYIPIADPVHRGALAERLRPITILRGIDLLPEAPLMSIAEFERRTTWTADDLAAHLGDIPLSRIRFDPPPGTAVEKDVVDRLGRDEHILELVDGVLVEKPMGYRESLIAARIITFLNIYLFRTRLGRVSAPDGALRLAAGVLQAPDVAYVSNERLPGGRIPAEPVPNLVPDLAVEVLSAGNTEREMKRKLRACFDAGVRLVWHVDPRTRSVDVFTAPDSVTRLTAADALTGGGVLPGFSVSVGDLFADTDD
jgi:Uma2 family endonuclease